jgi:tryptophan synthase alpha chain
VNSISARFEQLKSRRETALIVYLTAGFPNLAASIESLCVIADNGADLIEVGIPFSDPVADGPTIQHASQQALQAGTRLRDVIAALKQSPLSVPISLMSYLNPLMSYGREALLDDLTECGVGGLIVPDLPLEEADRWLIPARERDIALTLLVTPTSSDDRVRRIADSSDGFLYYVSVTGITGARETLPPDLFASLARVRKLSRLPVAVGFGISNAEQIRSLHQHADGVVIGSRVVQAIQREEDLGALIREWKVATRS